MKLNLRFSKKEKIWGWLYFLFQLLPLPLGLGILNQYLPRPLSDAGINLLYFSLNFLAIVLIFRKFLVKSLENAGKKFWLFLQALVLGFVAYWLCSILLGMVIGLVIPDFANVNDASISILAENGFWLIAVGTVLLVPTVEEIFYRGLLFQELQRKHRTAAYILSTAIFSAVHVVSYIGAYDPLTLAVCFLQYIPAGIWLAWAYEKSGSIYAPIIIHTAINALGMIAMR